MRDQTVSTFVLEIPDEASEKIDRARPMAAAVPDWSSRPRSRGSERSSRTASSIGEYFKKPVRFDSSALKTSDGARGGDGDKLDRGARVRHEKFGDGVILKREGTGDSARLTVYFDRGGSKKFVARYAKLTKL